LQVSHLNAFVKNDFLKSLTRDLVSIFIIPEMMIFKNSRFLKLCFTAFQFKQDIFNREKKH